MSKFGHIDTTEFRDPDFLSDTSTAYTAGQFDDEGDLEADWIYDAYQELGLGHRNNVALY